MDVSLDALSIMSTKKLITPELLPGLERALDLSILTQDLHGARRLMDEVVMLPLEAYARPDVTVEKKMVPHATGGPDVKVLIYTPEHAKTPMPALLSIHGGGYVLCTAEISGPSNVRTAAEVGCVVIAVDYRLAPETKAPGAVEDCYSALKWLHEHAEELGVDPGRIAIGGESAGGGFTAALALLARDRGEFPICFQMLIYPMLDDRTVTRTDVNPNVGEFLWTPEMNAFGWASLLDVEPGSDNVSPYAAAARATDLAHLPPAYISVGALDLFLEENIDYAGRMLRAGVAVELHIFPGAYHGYEIAYESDMAIASEKERREALRNAFAASEQ